jgi:hypothetical protein
VSKKYRPQCAEPACGLPPAMRGQAARRANRSPKPPKLPKEPKVKPPKPPPAACLVVGCERPAVRAPHGLCRHCQIRARQIAKRTGQPPTTPPPLTRVGQAPNTTGALCRADGCGRPGSATEHGLCHKCYQREVVNPRVAAAQRAARGDVGPTPIRQPATPKPTKPRERTERNQRVADNIGLAYWALNKRAPWLVGDEDAQQEAAIGLIFAANAHDPEKGKLSTIAVQRVGWRIYEHLERRPLICEPRNRGWQRAQAVQALERGEVLPPKLGRYSAENLLQFRAPTVTSLDAPVKEDSEKDLHALTADPSTRPSDVLTQTHQTAQHVREVLGRLEPLPARTLALWAGWPCPCPETAPALGYESLPARILAAEPDAFTGVPLPEKGIAVIGTQRRAANAPGNWRATAGELLDAAVEAFFAEAEDLYDDGDYAAELLAVLTADRAHRLSNMQSDLPGALVEIFRAHPAGAYRAWD